MERMFPNKDGWLSVETVSESGERVTVFHGVLEVSSAAARKAWKEELRAAVRAHATGAPTAPCRSVPLFQGRVVVSLPQDAAVAATAA
mmetsp:Transcript_62914/g.194767  ORF Transcript_62914/g.194767 Transcript_62914/m.194767 type:complete len:88 (-) Transcript_62914:11-274(-)